MRDDAMEDLHFELKAAREEVARLTHALANALRERDELMKTVRSLNETIDLHDSYHDDQQ